MIKDNNLIKVNNSRFEMKGKKVVKGQKKQNNKNQSKRLKTFNSSQFSLLQDKHQLSSIDFRIFKNQGIIGKRQNSHSALSQYASTKQQPKPPVLKKKKNKQKLKIKKVKEEEYEHIKYEEISNLSDIIFSNEETKRTSSILGEKYNAQIPIQMQDTYTVDSNKMLRFSIRKEYQQKIQAATKIQKVFRGYMTRKILMKYVKNEEEKLLKELFHKSANSSERRANSSLNEQTSHEGTFRDASAFNQFHIEPDKFNHTIRPRLQFIEGNAQQVEDNDEMSQSSSNSEEDQLRYRHKEPIYSHEQIGKLLEESSEEYDAYEPDIIFETNDEYIESRKSSLQNKNEPENKLSRHSIMGRDKYEEKQQQFQQKSIKQISDEENMEEKQKSLQKEKSQENLNQEGSITKRSQYELSLIHEDINKLKEEEKEKWDEVIQMITGQIVNSREQNSQMIKLMKKILSMSQKNKQFLDSTQSANLEGTNEIGEISGIALDNIKEFSNENRLFRKKNLEIQIPKDDLNEELKKEIGSKRLKKEEERETGERQEIFKELSSDTCPVPYKENFHTQLQRKMKQKQGALDHTGKIKSFISSNLQDDTLNEMLKIREELLEKRQSQELFKLNKQLRNRELTQEQFLAQLEGMTRKFIYEKEAIDKARQDIEKGYKAAMNLVRQSFYDAKRLGFKLSMSRSQDNLKYKNAKTLMNEIVVDEITPKSGKKSLKDIFLQDEKRQNEVSENNSSIDFTEEELDRFRKIQSTQLNELNYMNKNLIISDDFFKQQQAIEIQQEQQNKSLHKELYHLDEEQPKYHKENISLNDVIEFQLELMVVQFATQIITKPLLVEKFIDRSQFMIPPIISQVQRERFIGLIEENLPPISVLKKKMNQKISPLPKQILKCMRLDFSDEIEEEQEENYEEISKYQFVISQEICAKSVLTFKSQLLQIQTNMLSSDPEMEEVQRVRRIMNEGQFPQSFQKFITQRDKFIGNKKQHSRDLFWEVMNIQIHCIFDAWNEQIIQIRSQKPGFSGIGLNQLSAALVDHNKPLNTTQAKQVLNKAKQSLKETLDQQTQINAKILKQNFKQMCYSDSAWIYYADEALSYGLELVYLIEEELYKEVERQIKKIVMKRLFN